jgi:hypothetical protein
MPLSLLRGSSLFTFKNSKLTFFNGDALIKIDIKHKILIVAMVFITLLIAWFIWPTPYKSYSFHTDNETYDFSLIVVKENRISHKLYTTDNTGVGFLTPYKKDNFLLCNYKLGLIVCRK